MELRCCAHQHFIQAVRGGLVIKTPNIDSCGKPALRFKKLKDVYKSDYARSIGFHSTFQTKTGGYMGYCGEVKVERSCLPIDGKIIIKSDPETCELSFYRDDNSRNGDWDDLNFGKMTLKQLQNICKPKKRKLSKSVELAKWDAETSSPPKQDPANLESKEDDIELDKPLSSLKLKRPRNLKPRRKCVRKHVFPSSESAVETEQSSNSPQDLQQSNRDPFGAINSTDEIRKPDSSVCEDAICDSDVSISTCQEKAEFYTGLCKEVHEGVDGSEWETGDSFSVANVLPKCAVNEVSYEYLENVEPASLLPVNATIGTTADMCFSEMTNYESSVNPISKLEEENNSDLLNCDNPLGKRSPAKDPSFETNGSCRSSFFMQEKILCQIDSFSEVQVHDMESEESLRCMVQTNSGDRYMFDKGIKEDSIPDVEANVISNSSIQYISSPSYNPCLDPSSIVDSVDESSIISEHSCFTTGRPVCAGANGTRNWSAGSHSSDDTDRLTAMGVFESHHYLNQEHSPKRLFPMRKALSPTSQEKLRQAVDSNLLHGSIEHCSLGGADVTSPEKIIKKQKNGSSQFVPKGILKGTHISSAIPRATTECTSIHSRSQKAITFSQRQMHDIECLAMKLRNELKSMKDIVEETLHFQGCPSTSLKYAADEMRMAIEKAAEVEEITSKWLSMMARDCNRFCKIMRVTGKKGAAAASGYRVHKGRKKITFADEAGGMLCHVKVFENSPAPLIVSESVKLDPQD